MKRYGLVIKVKSEKLEEYKQLHTNVWPGVLHMIHTCKIRNYSIYLKDNLLFAYFEYIGTDFSADMAKMATDPTTQEWWQLTDPCQEGLPGRKPGQWWADMDEVFHTD